MRAEELKVMSSVKTSSPPTEATASFSRATWPMVSSRLRNSLPLAKALGRSISMVSTAVGQRLTAT